MNLSRGSILIITLWVLSLLAIFAINLSFGTRMQLHYARHLQNRLKMYYLAQAGIERAILELSNDENEAYDAINESWANNEESFKELPLGDGFITLSYNLDEYNTEDKTVLYGVADEASRIDINNTPSEILVILLERLAGVRSEEAEDIASAIIDWRDKDSIVSSGGAEDEYYQGQTIPYKCKNGKFQVLEELLLVKGMNPDIFSKIKQVITVYDTDRVNINTAGFLALYALGLSDNLCEQIIRFRQGNDGQIGTEDDSIFASVSELRDIGPLFTEESLQINRLTSNNMLTVKSDTFRINAVGHLSKEGQSQLQRNIVCVLKRQKAKEPQILYWHED